MCLVTKLSPSTIALYFEGKTVRTLADLPLSLPDKIKTVSPFLIPIAKAFSTDIGCRVADIGIQVHGGMGYVEETGVAQVFRDVRVTAIYEGTNGIQAIDLIGRKLADSGKAANGLIDEIGGLHDAINITKESIGITSDSDVDIIEYPEVKEFNLFNFISSDDEKSEITDINLENLFPKEVSNELKALNIIPVMMNDEIQLLVPYNIEIN